LVACSLCNCGNEKKNLTINRRIFRERGVQKKKKKHLATIGRSKTSRGNRGREKLLY
jgi:hypothetical protein